MAVKFQGGKASGATPPRNLHEFPPGRSAVRARRKWMFVLVAVVLVAAGLIVNYISTHELNRWLPERPGEAVVVEKLSADRDGRAEHQLRVRISVPAASPEEAALLPANHAGRAEAIAPKELEDVVTTPEADWAAVEPGARMRASYQLNIRRTEVLVRTLYLDHLEPPAT